MKKNNRHIPFGAMTAAIAAALLAPGCASNSGPGQMTVSRGTVIQDVTVVDTRDGSLANHMNVLVDEGRIVRVTTSQTVIVTGTAQMVNGSGKYVVPGFLDMHTHATAGSAARQADNFALLLANGITGIREMAGSPELIARARQTNIEIAAGRIDGPEILAIPGDLFIGATQPQAAIAEVDKQKAAGADFIKLIAANKPTSLAILSEAKAQGLTVAGHLSPSLSAEDSSNAGWRSIEHLGAGMGFLLDCAVDEGDIRRSVLAGEGAKPVPFSPAYVTSPMLFRGGDTPIYQRILDSYSEQKCSALARVFARNQTWNVPTLNRVKAIQISDDKGFRTDPNLMYIDRATAAMWQGLGDRYANEFARPAALTLSNYYAKQKEVVKLLQRHGVKMLAGSDCGGSGIWMIPGFSLHQEFNELYDAGLTPLQVLQMTTLNGAEFLHREATMGTVAEGKNADLVLLDGNPIESVVNLDRISGVFLKGRYFPKAALDKMKSDVADAVRSRTVSAIETEDHTDVQ